MKTKDPICRSFRQDFPEFVDRVTALGLRIQLSQKKRSPDQDRVFWANGYKQLTGYTSKADGSAFTYADAVENIDKFLTAVESDRAEMAKMTVQDRFARVIAGMRQIVPQYRMIGETRAPGGDVGNCFFYAAYDGSVILHEVGNVANARAEWIKGESDADHLARFCDMLESDFAGMEDEWSLT